MATATQDAMELDPKYDHYDFPTATAEARPGLPGHLTKEQQAQVNQLRLMLESEGATQRIDTLTLLRFLRARKFDVNAAKNMFLESEEWRKAVKVYDYDTSEYRLLSLEDPVPTNAKHSGNAPPPAKEPINLDMSIADWDKDGSFKQNLSKYYKQFYHKTDKDGRPCYFEQLGGVDLAALHKAGFTFDKMLFNLAVEYEKMVDPRLPACSRKAGHLLETSCTVMDAAGLSIFNPGQFATYIRMASTMSNANYPERLGRMYIINAGYITSKMVWPLVKGFLDPVTASKIFILTGSYKKDLLAQIPAENLPEKYGGKCKCQGGCELSDAGPWRESEWTKPAWWQKKADDTTIENKPTEIGTGNGAAQGQVQIASSDELNAPAPAAA
ncbi:Uu.00g144420.m01.CDS01 [Anthostomella pinea]|uniref:Uu.00g144420.m01.CDS01 n=1 Tax=Anthostomella pinea TaxID=933095 RepID=A0AAI8VQU3_9PEZI|nr:Uu.00g144420.m01.CDS01 [Anthostomella pinea]